MNIIMRIGILKRHLLVILVMVCVIFMGPAMAKPPANSCNDTDGGDIITLFGTISGYYNKTIYNHNDYCIDAGAIVEYYCSGVYKNSSAQSCGTDVYTGDGYCYNGDVYRNFSDYFCANGSCSLNTTRILQQECLAGQYCLEGICLWNNTCSDTDGGNLTAVFGATYGYFNNTFYNSSDYCVDSGNIREYYCFGPYSNSSQQSCGTDGYNGSSYCYNGDLYRTYLDYYCLRGACSLNVTMFLQQDCVDGQYCTSGQCLWNDTCSDTDGGIVMTLIGTVSGLLNGTNYSYTDYCLGNGTQYLVEYYCSGGHEYSYNFNCDLNGTTQCVNGACI